MADAAAVPFNRVSYLLVHNTRQQCLLFDVRVSSFNSDLKLHSFIYSFTYTRTHTMLGPYNIKMDIPG